MFDELDLEWFVRDNEEIDEKLPIMAKDVRIRRIDYNQINEEPDPDVVSALIEVLREHLYSFEDMTQEEVTYSIQQLWIAAVLSECVDEGMLNEVDGRYTYIESDEIRQEVNGLACNITHRK